MKYLFSLLIVISQIASAQVPVDMKNFRKGPSAEVSVRKELLHVNWPGAGSDRAGLVLNLAASKPLFHSMWVDKNGAQQQVAAGLDPVFLLTVGKRELNEKNGWTIFFDRVPLKPFTTSRLKIDKKRVSVFSEGNRTRIRIDEVTAPDFNGYIDITLYPGTHLFNIAAVMSTSRDSAAILYDAGLVSTKPAFKTVSWSDTRKMMQEVKANSTDTARNEMVKYRTIIGSNDGGSVAVFPAPHQYFYPLDEAFNLRFTWHGSGYRKMVPQHGIGIRQDLYGDRRYVPWFNAPPGTAQRLNFYCLLSGDKASAALETVKAFTHDDRYLSLPGYKTLASHFHNEFIMSVVRAGSPVPDTPNFVNVLKELGVDMLHLGEFHYTAHPKGPDSLRLAELRALFEQARRLSSKDFLIMPGEEPNEFLGGHWMQLFPRPVYWIMSRKSDEAFVSDDPQYGKIYRIGNKEEMLRLLELEKGLAWTAHPRIKGSTGYPDRYREEAFFKSPHFLGGAWKPMPADLSRQRLGERVLHLLDDMHNWGYNKKVLAEADLFTIEPDNEMYAHMNINYMQLDQIPSFEDGWMSVVDALQQGRFFSTTGEVLIPSFTANGIRSGDTVTLNESGTVDIRFDLQWTFPMEFAEVISGDGHKVYREKIALDTTLPHSKQTLNLRLPMKGRRWLRVEAWDVAGNGAFTQAIRLQ